MNHPDSAKLSKRNGKQSAPLGRESVNNLILPALLTASFMKHKWNNVSFKRL